MILKVLAIGVLLSASAFADSASVLGPKKWGSPAVCEASDLVLVGSSAGVQKCAQIDTGNSSCLVEMTGQRRIDGACRSFDLEVGVEAHQGVIACRKLRATGCTVSLVLKPGLKAQECDSGQNEVVVAESGGFVSCAKLVIQ